MIAGCLELAEVSDHGLTGQSVLVVRFSPFLSTVSSLPKWQVWVIALSLVNGLSFFQGFETFDVFIAYLIVGGS